MSSVWAVLPTYNEAENLGRLVEQLLGVLSSAQIDHHVLVVDDGSPDGTGAIADRLAATHAAVEVIHRKRKDGLGQAYLAGFDRALQSGADLVVEMDADFSHDPRDVPRLVNSAEEADVVLGSRYAPGGGVRDWSALRRIVSRAGCWYARTVLGVPVRDLTGGFKCMRRPVIEHIRTTDTHSSGYCFQIEWTYRALRAGFRVREVPIVFSERRAGRSKMSPRIALEATWRVPALRAACGSPVVHRVDEGVDVVVGPGRNARPGTPAVASRHAAGRSATLTAALRDAVRRATARRSRNAWIRTAQRRQRSRRPRGRQRGWRAASHPQPGYRRTMALLESLPGPSPASAARDPTPDTETLSGLEVARTER